MILTLNIDTSSNQAQAFIDFIKTLDFIKIDSDNINDVFSLTDEQKKILDQRKLRHQKKESKSFTWEEIESELRNSPK